MLQKYSPDQLRDDHGRWTDQGGSSRYQHSIVGPDGTVYTDNVYDAARALYEGRRVDLSQPRTASVLIDHLGKVAERMIALHDTAPNFDLCKVTISGTNLFCADTKGIPRAQMPQIPRAIKDDFFNYLKETGHRIGFADEYAAYLRPTQNELNGAAVAALAEKMRAGKWFDNPIIVSRDNYILDGHHQWAARVGLDAANNKLGELRMPVARVNLSITDLMQQAEDFTEGKGKKPVHEAIKEIYSKFVLLMHKFNPNHDERGRFTTGDGLKSSSSFIADVVPSHQWLPGGKVEVLVNPRVRDVKELARETYDNMVRVLRDRDNNIYVWDASSALHQSMRDTLQLDDAAEDLWNLDGSALISYNTQRGERQPKEWLQAAQGRPMSKRLVKFDPSQPRDERGRWTDAGAAEPDDYLRTSLATLGLDAHFVERDGMFAVQRSDGQLGDFRESKQAAIKQAYTTLVDRARAEKGPPLDKPVTLVLNGSFNPPHEGHVSAMQQALSHMRERGYDVQHALVVPSPTALIDRKLGAGAYPLSERVQLARRQFAEVAGVEVTGAPSEALAHKTGKLRRTDAANWIAEHYPGTSVVSVTGHNDAPAYPGGVPEGRTVVYEGAQNSKHAGYYYLSLHRPGEGVSSTKIRAAIREGRQPPGMRADTVEYLRDMFARHPDIKKRELLTDTLIAATLVPEREIVVRGAEARERVIKALQEAFPGKPWQDSIVDGQIVVEGVDAYKRVHAALARLGKADWDESKHPRDERGRWISGLGTDLEKLPGIKEAIDRNAWSFKKVGERDSYGQKRTTYSVVPNDIPAGWQTFERPYPFNGVHIYDPAVGHIVDGYVQPKDGVMTRVPKEPEPNTLYRGMSYEEYQQAKQRGFFQSAGGYNIGDAQVGLTYFSVNPDTAESYASGFAPWQYTATPTRPAVVVAIKDPGDHVIMAHIPNEVGLRGQVPFDAVSHVFVGTPYAVYPGTLDVISDHSGVHEGSRMSPSTRLAWTRRLATDEFAKYDPDQPRDYHGRWTELGLQDRVTPGQVKAVQAATNRIRRNVAAAYSVAQELNNQPPPIDDGGIKQFLNIHANFYNQQNPGGDNPAAWTLQHGRAYPFDSNSFAGERQEQHACYKNATLMAVTNPDLTYVEGYVSIHGVPLQHAWLVDHHDHVIDPTVRDKDAVRGYFGVPIRTSYLKRATLRRGAFGVLTWQHVGKVMKENPDNVVEPHGLAKFNPNHDELGRFATGAGLRPSSSQIAEVATPYTGNKKIEVLTNPQLKDLKSLARDSYANMVRVLRDNDGNIYVWDSDKSIHYPMEVALGLEGQIGPGGADMWFMNRKGKFQSDNGSVADGLDRPKRTFEIPLEWMARAKGRPVAKRLVLVKYSPDQPRDDHGRWTDMGAGEPTRAKVVEIAAKDLAKEYGFNPDDVSIDEGDKTFELNGKTYHYAGAAYFDTGKIVLYPRNIPQGDTAGVMAHEVMHHKFEAYRKDLDAETKRMFRELYLVPRGGVQDPMRPDGTLQHGWEDRFPMYQQHTKLTTDMNKMIEDDGVSSYSRDWWDAWKNATANTDQAYHETLAEIARHDHVYSLGGLAGVSHIVRKPDGLLTTKPLSPEWRGLYEAVNQNWNRRRGLQKYSPDQPRDDHGRWTDTGSGFGAVTPQAFVEARSASTRAAFLSPKTAEDLKSDQLYLGHGGKVGYALDKDGDLQNVFNNGGPRGAGMQAVVDAIKNGANTLDCFDGYLPEAYAKAGFEVTGRMPFNDLYAPKDWDYEAYGRPDVVFMAYRGGDRATIDQRIGSFPAYQEGSGKTYTDFDTAKAASRGRVMDKRGPRGASESAAGAAKRYRPEQFHKALADPARGTAGRRELLIRLQGRLQSLNTRVLKLLQEQAG